MEVLYESFKEVLGICTQCSSIIYSADELMKMNEN